MDNQNFQHVQTQEHYESASELHAQGQLQLMKNQLNLLVDKFILAAVPEVTEDVNEFIMSLSEKQKEYYPAYDPASPRDEAKLKILGLRKPMTLIFTPNPASELGASIKTFSGALAHGSIDSRTADKKIKKLLGNAKAIIQKKVSVVATLDDEPLDGRSGFTTKMHLDVVKGTITFGIKFALKTAATEDLPRKMHGKATCDKNGYLRVVTVQDKKLQLCVIVEQAGKAVELFRTKYLRLGHKDSVPKDSVPPTLSHSKRKVSTVANDSTYRSTDSMQPPSKKRRASTEASTANESNESWCGDAFKNPPSALAPASCPFLGTNEQPDGFALSTSLPTYDLNECYPTAPWPSTLTNDINEWFA
jgi:hypothetical protein